MTDDQIRDAAREQYGSNNVEIDEDATVSHADDGHAWVRAWVRVEESVEVKPCACVGRCELRAFPGSHLGNHFYCRDARGEKL